MPRKRNWNGGGTLTRGPKHSKKLRIMALSEKGAPTQQSNLITESQDNQAPPTPTNDIPTQTLTVIPPQSQPLPRRESRPSQIELQQARRGSNSRSCRTYRRKKKTAHPGVAREHNYDTFREVEYDQDLFDLDIGKLGDVVCKKCGALRFRNELDSICCSCGNVRLPLIPLLPAEIRKYYDPNHPKSRMFLRDIRRYNNAHSFASLGLDNPVVKNPDNNAFMPVYKIHGKMYHRLSALEPNPDARPAFAQAFFFDSENEIQNRMQAHQQSNTLDEEIIIDITTELHRVNPFIKVLKDAIQFIQDHGYEQEAKIVLCDDRKKIPQGAHERTFNCPTADELAIIVLGDLDQATKRQDVVISYRHTGHFERLNSAHRCYDPLLYVVLFPHGSDGWNMDLKKHGNSGGRGTLTEADYFRYKLHTREGEFIMKSRRLMQQYAVDGWYRVDSGKLLWQRNNQGTLRAEKYQGLFDAQNQNDQNVDLEDRGRRVILSPTFYGSPRWYQQQFQDAMALVRYYGKPDLFITMTTNPNWTEIHKSLNPGETAADRPDLSCRVFYRKYLELKDDLLKRNVLGHVIAHCATIEFQKRGLPHVHILLILAERDKLNYPKIIDCLVCAEIPNRQDNPLLYDIVVKNNIHGPCGVLYRNQRCMTLGDPGHKKCAKEFPKKLLKNTIVVEDGYPQYRRRSPADGGQAVTKLVNREPININNSWVVPYNPFLSLKYKCHLNVEVVHSTHSVKYLYKYVFKGPDRINVSLNIDEIENFINCRYISSSEAFWKHYKFKMHSISPNIERLPCHLENDNEVVFNPDRPPNAEVLEALHKTKLTEFFNLNQNDPFANDKPYVEIVKYYTWNQGDRKWQLRKKGTLNSQSHFVTDTIGRIPIIAFNQHQKERYYLRMLLLAIRGPKSYENLKTVDGEICVTFEQACLKRGLIKNNKEVYEAMDEVKDTFFGTILIDMFCTILIHCKPTDPKGLYEQYQTDLCMHMMKRDHVNEPSEAHINEVLKIIKKRLESDGYKSIDFGIPEPKEPIQEEQMHALLAEEFNFDFAELEAQYKKKYCTLTRDQKGIFDEIYKSVESDEGGIFSLNAPAGSGKTYVVNLLLSAVRSKKKIALATAVSGIAALLLDNGRTCHSRFGLPLNIKEKTFSAITKDSPKALPLKEAKFLVIDEVTMGHRHMYECIDRSLRDIRSEPDKWFGGLTVLFCGDWRQILPVVPHGTSAQVKAATLKNSEIWHWTKKMELFENLRIQNDSPLNKDFAKFLEDLGDGEYDVSNDPTYERFRENFVIEKPTPSGFESQHTIRIPEEFLVRDYTNAQGKHIQGIYVLINEVYENLQLNNYQDPNWLAERTLIAAKNQTVAYLNWLVLSKFPCDKEDHREYLSHDESKEESTVFDIDLIHRDTPPGFPQHVLELKKGVLVMLLRNLNPSEGHCNGSRYVISNLMKNLIECEAVTGKNKGTRVLFPRIYFQTLENYHLNFVRHQFPLKLAFAMTANRSQGQSMKKVGIYLPTPFFSHGQLYVACSRVTSPDGLKICVGDSGDGSSTENTVFKDILNKRLDKQQTPMSVYAPQLRNLPNRRVDRHDNPWQPLIVIDAPAQFNRSRKNNPSVLRDNILQSNRHPSTSNVYNNRQVGKTPYMLQADHYAISNGIEHRSLVETKSDGNCFFHAAIDQLMDPEIRDSISDRAKNIAHDHVSIRLAFADYLSNDVELNHNSIHWQQHKTDYIDDLLKNDIHYQGMSIDQVWEDLLQYIATPGNWAKDIFITAAAYFFGKDINLYYENHHYTHPGSIAQDQTQPSPPMTIAHLNQNHFQSIRRQ